MTTTYLHRREILQFMVSHYKQLADRENREYNMGMVDKYKWELVVLDLLLELKMIEI